MPRFVVVLCTGLRRNMAPQACRICLTQNLGGGHFRLALYLDDQLACIGFYNEIGLIRRTVIIENQPPANPGRFTLILWFCPSCFFP